MTLVDKIQELCISRDTTLIGLEREICLSRGSIRRWDKKSHSISLIRKEGSCAKSLVNFEEFKKL